ncbi:MAG: Coenzyme F420 hydrogenase/dehydrogenase, beta subunit C-terminal domain [Bacteroides sp.]|uniref:coenzyme F420 hydrogenase/dehydrogenase beta subunit N-terminal domain-containing protein n=1 Tax=Bacteroides sp. TaxID=29523 RepID=UPI002FC8C216
MNNIDSVKDCYGCGVCSTVCPKEIIRIEQNGYGFYEPKITESILCINCGLCIKVCSFTQGTLSETNPIVASYAAWSNDEQVRRKSSSGGIGFELGRHLIEEGYKVCGVRYNPQQNRAEHYIASTIEEFIPSIGSKYIQSYTVDALKGINPEDKYLVTGTPCQIDSFRRHIKRINIEDNFILMDFFCHGVPSKLLWDKYLSDVEKTTGKVIYASWRNKTTGWHDAWTMAINVETQGEKVNWHDSYNILLKGEKDFYNSRYSQGDPFYCLFLSDNCLGKACYDHCKYKYDRSAADIRIGDLWGKKYRNNKEGVSGVVTFTTKGDTALRQANCTLIEEPFEMVAEGQMKAPAQRGKLYEKLNTFLHNEKTGIKELHNLVMKENKKKKQINRLKHPIRTLLNLVKKIAK